MPATAPAPEARRRFGFRRAVKALWRLSMALALFAVLAVLAFRFVDPPGTITMGMEAARLGPVKAEWRDIAEMSDWMPRAAAAAEDAKFCDHWGFDVEAIEAAWKETRRLRGGSTISQQVAKNVFLWQGRSWVRKGLEAGFTGLIELLWPKRRIMEVYLNVAEMGEGVFGVAAAAQHDFGKDAADLSQREAALLASVLPSPKRYSADKPGNYMRKRAGQVAGGAETLLAEGRSACFETP